MMMMMMMRMRKRNRLCLMLVVAVFFFSRTAWNPKISMEMDGNMDDNMWRLVVMKINNEDGWKE
jgi:hypothetical protein